MLTAMGHHGELRVHARGALRNGCTVEEIQEVIIQAAAYCGFPAALSATRAIQAELNELAKEAAEEQASS